MAEIKLINITKIFDKHVTGLKNLTIQIKDGEFFTILGPSGSGKSTILRVIAGLEKQDKGEVFIDEVNVNGFPPQQRNIAFVFQSYALYPHMNVYENIAVGLRIKGYASKDIQSRIEEVTELLEISELLKRRPKALSGGQRQRVALARAIAKRPKVFLLDEPLSNLDALLRERMRTELKLLFNKLKTTVIYVTHDQQEAMSLSDRIALVDKGMLKQIGTPEELYAKPENLFVASFLGSPRINMFKVNIEQEFFVYGSLRWQIPENYLSKVKNMEKVIIGIRPEDVKVYLKPERDSFSVKISGVERIGKYSILNLNWQDKILKVIVDKELVKKIESGHDLWIEFDNRSLCLFDMDNHLSL